MFVATSPDMLALLVSRGADKNVHCEGTTRLNRLLSHASIDRKLLECLLELGAKPDGLSVRYAMNSKDRGGELIELLDRFGAKVWDVDLKSVHNKNAREFIYNAQQRAGRCRAACLCILAIRRFRSDECADRVFAHLQREIVEVIARYVWSTRRDRCWHPK